MRISVIIRVLIVLALATAVFGGAYVAVKKLYLEPEKQLREQAKLPPPTPAPDLSLPEFERCEDVRRSGDLTAAQAAFERFLRENASSSKRAAAEQALGEINVALFLEPKEGAGKDWYVVKTGDSLSRVSLLTKTPVELIMHLNKLPKEMLHPGQKLLYARTEFSLVLHQKSRTVILSNDGKFFRRYPTVAWPGSAKKPVVFVPKQAGKVMDKHALNDKGTVKPTDPAYLTADHQVIVSIPGFSLYTQPADPAKQVQRPPGGGIGLAAADMAEIAVLLPRGSPVTIE